MEDYSYIQGSDFGSPPIDTSRQPNLLDGIASALDAFKQYKSGRAYKKGDTESPWLNEEHRDKLHDKKLLGEAHRADVDLKKSQAEKNRRIDLSNLTGSKSKSKSKRLEAINKRIVALSDENKKNEFEWSKDDMGNVTPDNLNKLKSLDPYKDNIREIAELVEEKKDLGEVLTQREEMFLSARNDMIISDGKAIEKKMEDKLPIAPYEARAYEEYKKLIGSQNQPSETTTPPSTTPPSTTNTNASAEDEAIKKVTAGLGFRGRKGKNSPVDSANQVVISNETMETPSPVEQYAGDVREGFGHALELLKGKAKKSADILGDFSQGLHHDLADSAKNDATDEEREQIHRIMTRIMNNPRDEKSVRMANELLQFNKLSPKGVLSLVDIMKKHQDIYPWVDPNTPSPNQGKPKVPNPHVPISLFNQHLMAK